MFPLPNDVDGQNFVPMVLWQDGAGGWRPLPTTYTAGTHTITATTDHFSLGFLVKIDVKKWIAARRTDLANYLTGRSGVAQPSCGDENAARADGVQVTSDGGDTVKWCFGVENGQRVLKVANNRRTYTEVDYPSSWQVANPPSLSFTPETLSRTLGAGAALTPPADSTRIIDGADTLTLVVPPGEGGRVRAGISSESFLIDAIWFGVDTYSAIAKAVKVPNAATDGVWERIASRLADVGANDHGYKDAFSHCAGAVTDLAGPVSHTGPDLLQYAWDGVPALMKVAIDESGVTIYAAGIVLAAVGSAVDFVLTGVHLLISGVRELWDDLASIDGESDALYGIVISSPAGRWTDPSLTFTASSLGAVSLGVLP